MLLAFTNMGNTAQEKFRQQVEQIQGEDSDEVKAEILEKFEEVYEKHTASIANIYEKYLTEETVDASIAFYTSLAGEETIKALPAINEAVMNLSITFSNAIVGILMSSYRPDNEFDLGHYDEPEEED